MKAPDDLLWHYTDFKAFESIVTEGKIWASGIAYLNDRAEFLHLFKVAQQLIMRMGSPFGDGGPVSERELLEWSPKNMTGLYVTSFSRIPDDLSQWRAYSKVPPGFALGFDRDLLSKAASSQGGNLRECVYRHADQEDIAKAIIDEHYGRLRSRPDFDSLKSDSGNRLTAYAFHLEDIFEALHQKAVFCKHDAFSQEQEERIIFSKNRISGDPAVPLKTKFRQSLSMIAPYVEWEIPKLNHADCPLRHVIVGPGPHAADVVNVVAEMGFWSHAHASDIPYRNW